MVIFCIGTPEVIGDSIAPLVGDMLINNNVNAYVYGTTERPITGTNIDSYIRMINAKHLGEPIIAIDSALGNDQEIGCIKVLRGGVSPGVAVGKNLAKIGTIAILAQVGAVGGNALPTLMNIPYDRAISLAARCGRLVLSILNGNNPQITQILTAEQPV